ncbi:NAD-dependent epimerase/dehydratase family protein [Kitasatospora sp. NPDC058046]|uniref:NAD-dependent epimerase/dehydratase family protein n=1 Tax=Kitasatospora sp. NPDC058046 TaxID=3346312 RepID=UPI0036DC8B93
MATELRKVLVTGGSGFLGSEICRQLANRGTLTNSVSRRPNRELEDLGVRQYQADIAATSDLAVLALAAAGCDAVIHSAALVGFSGSPRPYWRTNVLGTLNVVAACRLHRIPVLVHTSAARVVSRPRGLENADETVPYPRHHPAVYPRTKAKAEQIVLAANSPSLATLSLRPHAIWGPDDPHLLPSLLRAVRGHRLRMPGDGSALVDGTHVRTAAYAHLLAVDRLHERQTVGGRAYFIAQGEPYPVGTLALLLLDSAGVSARWASLPGPLFRSAAAARGAAARVARSVGSHTPSRLSVPDLTRPHWFDLTAARANLGFIPPLTMAEGLAELTPDGRLSAAAELLLGTRLRRPRSENVTKVLPEDLGGDRPGEPGPSRC